MSHLKKSVDPFPDMDSECGSVHDRPRGLQGALRASPHAPLSRPGGQALSSDQGVDVG